MPTVLVGRGMRARMTLGAKVPRRRHFNLDRSSLSSRSDSVDTNRGSESDLSSRVTVDLENG